MSMGSDYYLHHSFASGNYVCFSDLQSASIKNVFTKFSVKYVYKGQEIYRLGSSTSIVRANEILYAASQPGEVYFENAENDRSIGLCVGFDEHLLLEAVRVQDNGGVAADPEKKALDISAFSTFLEGLHTPANQKISRALAVVCRQILSGIPIRLIINEEWFFQLVSEIVRDELPQFHAFVNLKFVKHGTKKEVLRRLRIARDYMEACFLENPSIPEIARVALLSDYHFFRCFKLAYGVSPHQYLLRKRLEFARSMLRQGTLPVHEVASTLNFANQFAFSKAFKQEFKISPKQVKIGFEGR